MEMDKIILLVGHTRSLHLCADSIIENLCIPNNAKIIGYTYDHIGWWNDKNFDKKIDIKNIWHSALKDYLISVNIRSINQNDLSHCITSILFL